MQDNENLVADLSVTQRKQNNSNPAGSAHDEDQLAVIAYREEYKRKLRAQQNDAESERVRNEQIAQDAQAEQERRRAQEADQRALEQLRADAELRRQRLAELMNADANITATPTPVEQTPAESKPVEQTPAEPKPVEQTPAELKPVEQTPSESKPIEQTPSESKPVEQTPAEPKPTENKPTVQTPSESKPEEDSSAPLVIDTGIDMELLRLDGFCVGALDNGAFLSYEELCRIERQRATPPAPVAEQKPATVVTETVAKPVSEQTPAEAPVAVPAPGPIAQTPVAEPRIVPSVPQQTPPMAPQQAPMPPYGFGQFPQTPPVAVGYYPYQGQQGGYYSPAPNLGGDQPLINYGNAGPDMQNVAGMEQAEGFRQLDNAHGLPSSSPQRPSRRVAGAFTTEELELLRGADSDTPPLDGGYTYSPAGYGAPDPLVLNGAYGSNRDRFDFSNTGEYDRLGGRPYSTDGLAHYGSGYYQPKTERMPRVGYLSGDDRALMADLETRELYGRYMNDGPIPNRVNDRHSVGAFAPDLSPQPKRGRGTLTGRDMELMSNYDSFLMGREGKDGFYGFDRINGGARPETVPGFTGDDIGYMNEFDANSLGRYEYSNGYRPQYGYVSFNPRDMVSMWDMGEGGFGSLGSDRGHAEWELTQLDRFMREAELRRKGYGSFGSGGEFGALFSPQTAMYDRYLASKLNKQSGVNTPSDGLGYLLSSQLGIAAEYDPRAARKLRKKTERKDVKLISLRHRYHESKLELALDSASLTFAKGDRESGREARRAERELEFWQSTEKRAIRGQRSDNDRYYSAVMLNPRRARLPRRAAREELSLLREKLMGLLQERDTLNDRLIALYRGGSGSKTYEQKRDSYVRKRVRRVYLKQKQTADMIESYRLPRAKKERVYTLMDRRTYLCGEIAGAEYSLRHSKLRGRARREKLRSLRRNRRELRRTEARLGTESRKLIARGSDNRRAMRFEITAWMVLILIIGAGVACYMFRDKLVELWPVIKHWFTPGQGG